MPLFSDMGELLGKGLLGGTCNSHTAVRVGQSLSARFANHLLTKMLTLAGTARYRAEYGRPETPRKQAYWVLNGIGRYTTAWPLPDSKSSGGDTVGDYGRDGGSANRYNDSDFASGGAAV